MAEYTIPLNPVSVGSLRDFVQFATATDVIDPNTRKSVRQLVLSDPDYACIRPVGTEQFYQGFATGMEVTHTIYTRYRSDASAYTLIINQIILPDTGQLQELQYEIMRQTDWMGNRVWSRFDVKLLSKET
jgi:head-tail adaptor